METFEEIKRPTKQEQRMALESYRILADSLERIRSENPEIEIEETGERIKVPLQALKFLASILKVTSQGKPVSIVPVATEMTTQAAAEVLGCSRPHIVKLVEEGELPYSKVGKHRRIRFEDLMAFKQRKASERESLLVEIMRGDEDSELYDS